MSDASKLLKRHINRRVTAGDFKNTNQAIASLAGEMGICKQWMRNWVYGVRPVSARRAAQLERVTGGDVPAHVACPHVFPDPEERRP